MTLKLKVLLAVECRNMKKPKLCRSRFDQTLGDNSWMLQKNEKAEIHDDTSVSTRSIWGRVFSGRKSEDDVRRIIGNLIRRAAADAGIDDYTFELSLERIHGDEEPFDSVSVLTRDD